MKRFFLSALALLFLLTATLWAGEKRPVLIINEDNDHYFKQTEDLMTLEALQAYIDRMKDSHVTHFFMCPQGQRTSYDSKVHERIWDGMADGSPVKSRKHSSSTRTVPAASAAAATRSMLSRVKPSPMTARQPPVPNLIIWTPPS